ncbi:hypothetical protein BEP19_06825 [Ammoniphilus oxalaticus]|uniref:RNA-binding S4 domain-containing protein n=1 Tax=Ammoniphilus oxalaticus TaxID=66863 RepID=A0A419SJJ2_9BACL|nr:YlmH/Sll1252 family protein [Ammoniphilus oxalaticus]RKD24116.1 hypothetical protein BEP19_06825 [Ammoniphilus oxalaticus]
MNLFEHFRKEEHPFIEQALDWLAFVEERHETKLTDFLDPRQVYILQTLLARFDEVKLTPFGGFNGAERCRVLLHQHYYEPKEDESGLAAFQLTASSQASFQKLTHRDILGALMAAGLKRDKFGDIHIHPDQAQIVVAEEIADYLRLQFTQANRVSVLLESIEFSQLIPVVNEWKTMNITVSSSRVDVVAGEVFRLSRSKILSPIRGGSLRVNWMVVDSPSFIVQEGDIVSLRGFGRFKIQKNEGNTRKGNTRLEIGALL